MKKGKKRGYIVDYIGLTENLTEALTLYAAADEAQELALGLKSITSEVPVLEERYQRLLQLFAAHGVKDIEAFAQGKLSGVEADASVVHEAVKLLKDEKQRRKLLDDLREMHQQSEDLLEELHQATCRLLDLQVRQSGRQ